MKYNELIGNIEGLHYSLKREATKAINKALTLRNWMIGHYIVEYEQHGEDRSEYGKELIKNLANRLKSTDIQGASERSLRNYRRLYQTYPQIWQTVSAKSMDNAFLDLPKLKLSQIRQTVSAELESTSSIPIEKLISNLSYSHFELLISIEDKTKRTYYELESIKGTWSVRQLKRQISSLYYERAAMSKDPETLHPSKTTANNIVHDIYTLEFLGLPQKAAVSESDLEKAILDNIEHFLLELGHGFCFEARQKRILIGDEYFFIDLVFYHRILKCHVLVELKVEGFSHTNAGQLNTYINFYKKEVMEDGDNPPIGILFVTDKNKTLVEYATAGMDEKLFVKQYLVNLPEKDRMEALIAMEIEKL